MLLTNLLMLPGMSPVLSGLGPRPGNPVAFSCHVSPVSASLEQLLGLIAHDLGSLREGWPGVLQDASDLSLPDIFLIIILGYEFYSSSFHLDIPLWGEAVKNY